MPTARQIEQRRRYAKLLQEAAADTSPTTGWGAIARVAQAGLGSYIREQADRMDKERKDEALRNLAAASQITFTPTFVGDDTGVESVTEDPRGALVRTMARSEDEPGKLMPFVLKTLSDEMASDRARQQALADRAAERAWEEKQRKLAQKAAAEQADTAAASRLEAARIAAGRGTQKERDRTRLLQLQAIPDEGGKLTPAQQRERKALEASVYGSVTATGKTLMTNAQRGQAEREHRELRTMARQAAKVMDRILSQARGAGTFVARAAKGVEELKAELKAITDVFSRRLGVSDKDRSRYDRVASRLFKGQGVLLGPANAARRAEVINLAVLDAAAIQGQKGKALSNEDFQRVIRKYSVANEDNIKAVISSTIMALQDKITSNAEEHEGFDLNRDTTFLDEIAQKHRLPGFGIVAAPSGGNPLAGKNPDFSSMTREQLAQIDRESLTTPQLKAMAQRLKKIKEIENKALGQ